MGEIKRMWVNQPSSLQEHHALHGSLVLAERESSTTWRAWFMSGDAVSQQLPVSSLSEGWPARLRRDRAAEVDAPPPYGET